jgi:hypothetical protein
MKRCRREPPDQAALRAKDNLAPPLSSVRSFPVKKCRRLTSWSARCQSSFLQWREKLYKQKLLSRLEAEREPSLFVRACLISAISRCFRSFGSSSRAFPLFKGSKGA